MIQIHPILPTKLKKKAKDHRLKIILTELDGSNNVPKLSVILPTYNRVKLINEAIQSVLRQTYTDFELIVVDDGSTDNTKGVVDSFKDSRIRYEYQENRGVSAARNTGIKVSTAEYITFLDSDDIYLENALQKSINSLDSNRYVGFSYGQAIVLLADGEVYGIKKSPFHDHSTVINSIDQVRELLSSSFIITPTVTARHYCLEEIGGFNEGLWFCEDYHLFIRMAKKYPSFYMAEPLIYIRDFSSQQLHSVVRSGREKAFPLILNEVFGDPDISPQFSDLKAKTYSRFYRTWMASSVFGVNMQLVRQYLRKSIRYYPQVIFKPEILYILYRYFASMLPNWLVWRLRNIRRRLFKYKVSIPVSERLKSSQK